MISEWRVVSSSNTGIIATYYFDDSLTIENLKGEQKGLLFDELKNVKEKICGLVPLGNDCYGIEVVGKFEQKALNCLAIDITNLGRTNELYNNYVWGEVVGEAGVKFVDLLYNTIIDNSHYLSKLNKVNDITYFAESRYNGSLYRTTITIRDLNQFKLWYTKYNITRNK